VIARGGPATIGQWAAEYAVLRPIAPGTAEQLAITARVFERWAGGPVRLDELDERAVIQWLRDLATKRSPATVRSKRVGLLLLWRAAADEGLCDPPLRRVRTGRVPLRPPEAWDAGEVERIMAACAALKRWHPCGLRRSEWWTLAISVAWDTALRWSDQMLLPVAAIREDRSAWVLQHKTQTPQLVRFRESTVELLRTSLEHASRSLVTPWPASHQTFARQFASIVAAAGVRRGSWKWLRRSSGTDAERQERGAGARQLGHRPGSRIAAMNYLDERICGTDWQRPRPLLPPR
jgi:hypothetical protein